MPLNIDVLQILLHMLNLVILAGGLSFLLFRPVSRFLEQRRAQFAEAERRNRDSAQENERLRAEYEQKLGEADEEISARKKIAEKEWAEVSARYISEAKEKAAAIVLAAEAEAERRKEQILESAQTEISELVVSATQKMLSDTVTPESDRALYDAFIRTVDGTVAGMRAKP